MEENQIQAVKEKSSGFAVAALVLGIIGVVFSFIPIINNAAFVLGVLALIFGIIGAVKGSKKTMAIIAIVLAVLAVIITIAMQKAASDALNQLADDVNDSLSSFETSLNDMSGENTEDILKNYVDVEIGEFTVESNGFFDETKLAVKVTNKSNEKKSFSIQLEAVDADGNRLNTDYIYANDLGAGQSQQFDTFTLVSSDDVEKLKAAEFKIVSVSMY